MKNILEILERELEERKLRSKEFYQDFRRLEKENKKLLQENQMLRNDLQELSKEFINQKQK